MGNIVGDIILLAFVIAFSPVPIIGIVLILQSPAGRRAGPAFALSWLVGLAIIGGIVLAVAGPADLADTGNEPSEVSSLIHLIVGLALMALAYRRWRSRPQPSETVELPKWMRIFDKVTLGKAAGLGVVLGGVYPKNLILTIAAATTIAQGNLATGAQIVALVIFIACASLSVLGPAIWYFAAAERATSQLNALSGWLAQNSAVVVAVILLVFGVSQLSKGLGGLLN